MTRNRKKVYLIGLIALIIYILYYNSENLKIIYIKVFKKNEIIANYNSIGQLNGDFTSYLDGNVYATAKYINGLKQGWVIEYYQNNQVKRRKFYRNDKATGNGYEYLDNGKLKVYTAYDINGNYFFKCHYNKSGNVEMEGYTISPNLYSMTNQNKSVIILDDVVHVDSSYNQIKDLYITIATPPTLVNNVSVQINNKVFKNLTMEGNTVKIINAFFVTGTYHVFVASRLIDKNNKVIKGLNLKATIIKR
jgi:hypothetical protein